MWRLSSLPRTKFAALSLRRAYAGSPFKSIDDWAPHSLKPFRLTDTIHPERLEELHVTLSPFRAYDPVQHEEALAYGHHAPFFHARSPEQLLRPDGTDSEFSPPAPFTRRMWAGTSYRWVNAVPLLVGDKATATCTLVSAERKGFDKGKPMIFVKQGISIAKEGSSVASIVEERIHVYLPAGAGIKSSSATPKSVTDLPAKSEFSYKYTPTAITLFRFSALTWNAHHIHLDPLYSQKEEGYPERLVHGPLSALMLLETARSHMPDIRMTWFKCRAVNPVIVNRQVTLHGAIIAPGQMRLWSVDDDAVVGMVGELEYEL